MLVYGKYESIVIQMLYVCVSFSSCSSSQCCVLHYLQVVNTGRGGMRRPYGGGIIQNRSYDCLVFSHECLISLPHHFVVSVFIICRGMCACTEML